MRTPLTVSEAAKLLGISERACRLRIYRNQIPHRRWGRKILIFSDELEAFLKTLPGVTSDEAAGKVEEGAL